MRAIRSHAPLRRESPCAGPCCPGAGRGWGLAVNVTSGASGGANKTKMKNRSRLTISCGFVFVCPGQGLIYENIYKQLKFEYIYNVLKYSILKLYAVKCILSVFSCFAKMRTQCGRESIAVFEYKSYLCEYKMRMYGKSYICFGARGEQRGRIAG